MDLGRFRIALFSGNYNYVRDGASQALNRLVSTLLAHGARVRVYSPVTDAPAFVHNGDLVPVPSIPFPGRSEYRVALGLRGAVRQDLAEFRPSLLHLAAPDWLGHSALGYARRNQLPVVASVHTRFDTYARYYHMGFLEPLLIGLQRNFYRRCHALLAPSTSMADWLTVEGMNDNVGIWSRGVDRAIFNPERRSQAWRTAQGIGPDEIVIGFLGRIVMEKGLDVFAAAIAALQAQGLKARILVVGDGPARAAFAASLPQDAVFTGFLQNAPLATAVAAMDIFLNPSLTETFGNVTLEAMACGVPVVAARATGTDTLVIDGVTGQLVVPDQGPNYACALAAYLRDPEARSRAGRAGAERALIFDWDAINLSVARCYAELLAPDPEGRPPGA